ncbi:tetratricopeptide repeat protein [Planctomycetota bacterium]|nr:tetratricopeptide repeat protein [Planctomycetota bacterium]
MGLFDRIKKKFLKKPQPSGLPRTWSSSFQEIDEILSLPSAEGRALSLREGSPEMHYMVARSSLTMPDADLGHGVSHLAELLSFDPGRAEWLALVDQYLERFGGDLEAMLPEGEERYFATEALRAHVHYKQGRLEDAVDLLCLVSEAKPQAQYVEAWALDWLEPQGAFEYLPGETRLRLLSGSLTRYAEHPALTLELERSAQRLARLACRLTTDGLGDPEMIKMVDMTIAGLHRKSGLFAEGLAHVRKAESNWYSATAEGLMLRQQGDLDAAEAAFERALGHKPHDLAACLEAGDGFFNARQWQRAKGWYDRVLKTDREHVWALPSALWCAWRLKSDSAFPDDAFPPELIELGKAGNPRFMGLFQEFRPYDGYLPEPMEATANSVQQVQEMHAQGKALAGAIRLTLSDVEGPSTIMAFDFAAGTLDLDCTLEASYENVASPDPREPVEPVTHTLWTLKGGGS